MIYPHPTWKDLERSIYDLRMQFQVEVDNPSTAFDDIMMRKLKKKIKYLMASLLNEQPFYPVYSLEKLLEIINMEVI